MKGNTNLAKGLEVTSQLFQGSRPDARKYLFIFTDGEPDVDPVDKIKELKAMVWLLHKFLKKKDVLLIVFGIGNVKHDNVHRLASPGCAFLSENFQRLHQMVKSPLIEKQIKLRLLHVNVSV